MQTPRGTWVFSQANETNGRSHHFIDVDETSILSRAHLTTSKPKRMRTVRIVYEWRYRNFGNAHWKTAHSLLTKKEAMNYYTGCEIEKHAGPFRVRK